MQINNTPSFKALRIAASVRREFGLTPKTYKALQDRFVKKSGIEPGLDFVIRKPSEIISTNPFKTAVDKNPLKRRDGEITVSAKITKANKPDAVLEYAQPAEASTTFINKGKNLKDLTNSLIDEFHDLKAFTNVVGRFA